MMAPGYRTVIIELDALLANASDGRAASWVSALRSAGHDVAISDVRERIGMSAERILGDLAGVSMDSMSARSIQAEYRHTFESEHLGNVAVLPGARDLLARFGREGYVVVLTSSGDGDLHGMRELLEHAQLTNALDEAVALPAGARSKPAPDILRVVLERTRTPAAQSVVVGDSPHDLAAARSAGVSSIALASGGWPAFSLTGSVAVYRDPTDLLLNFEMSPLSRSSVFEQLFAPLSTAHAFAV